MLLFVCSCFMDFVVVFVEAWWSLLFRDAVVCLLNRSKDGRKCFI